MISLGWLSEDGPGGQLHAAARKGKIRAVKKLLKEGTRVDYPNSRDQTALFCACYLGKEKTVKLLLKYGANANERSDNGSTAVHTAAWSCKTGLLLRLVRTGGNIRLHDNEGRTPKDWALERDKKKNKKMLILLDQMYMHAVALSHGEVTTGSPGEAIQETKSSASSLSALHTSLPRGKKTVETLGYGRMYMGSGNNQPPGYISTIPIIAEAQLSTAEGDAASKYVTGGFFTMQNLTWDHSIVTVKQLERTEDRARLDLLMDEVQTLGHLRHPKLLLLMAVAHSTLLDNMMLVFEHVGLNTLFYLLHEEGLVLKEGKVVSFLQQICEALIFVHSRGILHCCVTSHAAYICSSTVCKLGNFEYAVERCENQAFQKKSLVLQNSSPLAAYNWVAPEIHAGRPPTTQSDIYSFCALILEVYTGQVPFESLEAHDFRRHVATGKKIVQPEEGTIPLGLDHLVACGLSYRGVDRQAPLTSYRDHLSRELDILQTVHKSPGQVSRCTYTVDASPGCLNDTSMDATQDSLTDQDLVASLPDCLDGKDNLKCDRSSCLRRKSIPKQESRSAFDTSDKENLPPFPPKFQTVLDNALQAVSNIRVQDITFQESPVHYLTAHNSQGFHEANYRNDGDEGVVIFKRDHELKLYNNPKDIEIYDTPMLGEDHTHSTPIVTSRLHKIQQPVLKESPLQSYQQPSTSTTLLSKRWSFLARKSKSVGQLIQTFEAKARGQDTKSDKASKSDIAVEDADPFSHSVEREEVSTPANEPLQKAADFSTEASDGDWESKVSKKNLDSSDLQQSPNVICTSTVPDKDDSTNTISEANTTDVNWLSAIDRSATCNTLTDYQDMSKVEDTAMSLSLNEKESFHKEAEGQEKVLMSTMEAVSAPVKAHCSWPQQMETQQGSCEHNEAAKDIVSATTEEGAAKTNFVQTKESDELSDMLERQNVMEYQFRLLKECQASDKMSFTTDSSFISSGTEESSDSEGDFDSGSSTSRESLQLDPGTVSCVSNRNFGNSHAVHHKVLHALPERSAFEEDLTQISALEESVTSLDQPADEHKEDLPAPQKDLMAREVEELAAEGQQESIPIESPHPAIVQAGHRTRNDSILSDASLEVSSITSSAVFEYGTSVTNTRQHDSESKEGSNTSASSLEISSLTKALEEMAPANSQLTNVRMLESPTVKAVEMSDSSEDSTEDSWMFGDGHIHGAGESRELSKNTENTASPMTSTKLEFTREVANGGKGDCVENSEGTDGNSDTEGALEKCALKKTRMETYV